MNTRSGLHYGWIIVVVAFLSITTYGLFYSYSTFIEDLEAALHVSRTAISAVYTVYVAVYCLCSIPLGRLSDRYGPRKTLWLAALLIGGGTALCSRVTAIWQLYLFFGVIAGMGHGAIFVVPTSVLNRWFLQRKGLAVGIAISGLGAGLLLVPPAVSQIIELYGWRPAFLCLGITFFLINGLAATFIRNRPSDKGLLVYGADRPDTGAVLRSAADRHFTVGETVRTRVFWLLFMVCLCSFAAEQMVIVHIVPYSTALGMPLVTASLGLSALGIGTIFGRILSGSISDRIGRISTQIMCCILEAAGIFAMLAISGPLSLYLVMFLLGFGYGGWIVQGSLILGDVFGEKNLGMITGIWFISGLPAGVLGPLLGGFIFDTTGSYTLAILIAGGVCVLAFALSMLIGPSQKRLLQTAGASTGP